MTFGSAFAGIGGLDLGLERAGMECRWQVEIDPYCLKVLAKHWPNVKRYEDIRKLTGDELEPVDLVCGGFPCQDLSQAGKQAGIEGTRSGLWFDFARIVGMVGPRYVLVENVPGLLVRDAMPRVVGELARLGYVGLWVSLRASEFGAAHIRKRVFILAHRECSGRHDSQRNELRSKWTEAATKSGSRREDLAYRESRGLGELRQPSERERFIDRRDPDLADGDRRRRIVNGEAYDGDRHHAPGNHSDGRDPLVAHINRSVEDTGYTGTTEWSPQPAGVDRRRSSGDDCGAGRTLDHTQFPRLEIGDRKREQPLRQGTESLAPGLPAFAPGPADTRWPTILAARPDLAPALESPIRGVADGLSIVLDRAMSNRTKRLGRLGNAVVPQIAEWIGLKILESENGTH